MIKLKNPNCDKILNEMVTKLQNSKCDNNQIVTKLELRLWQTQKLKLWLNSKTQIGSKTQIVMKFNNSNWDETKKLKCWQNSQTQIVTKLKKSNCESKLKMWREKNLKTQNVTTPIVTNSKTQIKTRLKKTQIVTMLRNSNCDKLWRKKL